MSTRSRFNKRSRTMASLPPLLPFNDHKVATVLRSSYTFKITNGQPVGVPITSVSVLSGYSRLRSTFREMKLLKAKVWLVPTLSNQSSGLIAMSVGPKSLNVPPTTYVDFSCSPGCIARKSYQTLRGMYYPTEPAERNWIRTASSFHFGSAFIIPYGLPKVEKVDPKTGEKKLVDVPYSVQLILDCHVILRGRTAAKQISYARGDCPTKDGGTQ